MLIIDLEVDKITLDYSDFDIMTVIAVPCNDFDQYLSKAIRFATITDKIQIDQFHKAFENLEETDSTYSDYVDTRAKIRCYNNDKLVREYCIGNLTIEHGDKLFKNTKDIRDIIEYIVSD